jgi:hypothetical protein
MSQPTSSPVQDAFAAAQAALVAAQAEADRLDPLQPGRRVRFQLPYECRLNGQEGVLVERARHVGVSCWAVRLAGGLVVSGAASEFFLVD